MASGRPTATLVEDAVEESREHFDTAYGGFGSERLRPKFPRAAPAAVPAPHEARVGRSEGADATWSTHDAWTRWRTAASTTTSAAASIATAVDAHWTVPHFEKMLYDNAQLVLALIEASQAAADPLLAAVADDTLVYVDRDLSDAGGGFYSGEDADSIPPESVGEPGAHASEGAFYIWPQREVEALLGEADARVMALRFGLEAGGNAPFFDPQQEFTGKNLFYTAATFEDIAARVGRPVDDVVDVVARARPVLLEARNRRPRPSLDDKVLTSWNGLMIAAMARAGRIRVPPIRLAARTGSTVPRARRASSDRRSGSRRRRRSTVAGAPATPASTAIARTTPASSGVASSCCRQPAIRRGWPGPARCRRRRIAVLGQCWRRLVQHHGARIRPCCSVSRRISTAPSRRPGSVAVRNLIELVHLEPDEAASQRIARTLGRLGPRLEAGARAVPFMAMNLAACHRGLTQIVVVGPLERGDTRALQRVIAETYLPDSLVLPVDPAGTVSPGSLAAALPWLAPLTLRVQPGDGAATAYVCRGFTCEQPVTTPAALAALLRE